MPAGMILPVFINRTAIIPPKTTLVPNESVKLLGFFVVWYAPYPSNDPKNRPADRLGMLAERKTHRYVGNY